MTNQNTALPTSLPDAFALALDIAEEVFDIINHDKAGLCSMDRHKAAKMVEDKLAPLYEKIKTLEMQGKWLDISTAPKDGTQILVRGFIERLATGPYNEEYFYTAKYHKDFKRFIGPNGNEVGHAYLTHFQYISPPPSPDAQKESEVL